MGATEESGRSRDGTRPCPCGVGAGGDPAPRRPDSSVGAAECRCWTDIRLAPPELDFDHIHRCGEMPAAANVQHRRPSIEGFTHTGSPNGSRPVFIWVPGAGTLLRIAIGWMVCQDRHPPPPPPS